MNKTKEEAEKQYVYFWKSRSSFSQWKKSPFTVDGKLYLDAEHWMMAEKARLFGDAEIEEKVLATISPREVKALGRKVKNFDSQLWDSKCLDIVTKGQIHKFEQNPELKKTLLATAGKIICEASPVDAIWGCGHAEDDPRCWDEKTWRGKNYLGICLMRARDHFLSEDSE